MHTEGFRLRQPRKGIDACHLGESDRTVDQARQAGLTQVGAGGGSGTLPAFGAAEDAQADRA